MVTSDLEKPIDQYHDELAAYIRTSRSRTWRQRNLGHRPRSDQIFAGAYSNDWLPAPGEREIAALADYIEEAHDPALVRTFAALVQRSAIIDPEVSAKVARIISTLKSLGVAERCCAGLASQAQCDLDKLISAPKTWNSVDEVLGEGHCCLHRLLSLAWARLARCEADGPWRELLVTIELLRAEFFGTLEVSTRKSVIVTQSVLDLFSLASWRESSGVSLSAIHECLRRKGQEADAGA